MKRRILDERLNAQRIAPQRTAVVSSAQGKRQTKGIKGSFAHADLALEIVAIDIPVEPTVPSKMVDPWLGYSSPCCSASSMTVEANSSAKNPYASLMMLSYFAMQRDP
jgi:hypothetical protein